MDDHSFCRALLKEVKGEAKVNGIKDDLSVIEVTAFKKTYEASNDSGFRWTGQSCCKWAARATALGKLIDREEEKMLDD